MSERGCLDHPLLPDRGEAALRRAVGQYVEHYHAERNHQGLDNVVPFPDKRAVGRGEVTKSAHLGGLLSYYHREAG
ncbi:MAG: hypothetical protein IT368_14945 [Candidatus Hydrogenedentes bacterium]|nr:hypothetical protein [Candidatus Hydrogenedentota bacterium]